MDYSISICLWNKDDDFEHNSGGAGGNRTRASRFCRPQRFHFATAPKLALPLSAVVLGLSKNVGGTWLPGHCVHYSIPLVGFACRSDYDTIQKIVVADERGICRPGGSEDDSPGTPVTAG